MSATKKLAYTVHHDGQVFPLGATAEEIGPAAAAFGDHCWVGGKAPAEADIPSEGSPAGGLMLGTRLVTPPSGMPGNAQGEDPVLETLQLGRTPAPAEPVETPDADGDEPEAPEAPAEPVEAPAAEPVAEPKVEDVKPPTPAATPAKKTAARKATGASAS